MGLFQFPNLTLLPTSPGKSNITGCGRLPRSFGNSSSAMVYVGRMRKAVKTATAARGAGITGLKAGVNECRYWNAILRARSCAKTSAHLGPGLLRLSARFFQSDRG